MSWWQHHKHCPGYYYYYYVVLLVVCCCCCCQFWDRSPFYFFVLFLSTSVNLCLSCCISVFFLLTRTLGIETRRCKSSASPCVLLLPFSLGLSPYLESLLLDVVGRLSSLSKTPAPCCFCCCCCRRPRWISQAMRTWAAHHRPGFYTQHCHTIQYNIRLLRVDRTQLNTKDVI